VFADHHTLEQATMSITVHHPKTKQPIFTAHSPKRLMRTLGMVQTLRNVGVSSQSEKYLREKFGFFAKDDENPGPIYWTLAARLLSV
jgi:hypothetical protein